MKAVPVASADMSDYYIGRAVYSTLRATPGASLDQVLAVCEHHLGPVAPSRVEPFYEWAKEAQESRRPLTRVRVAFFLAGVLLRILVGLAAGFVSLSLFVGPENAAFFFSLFIQAPYCLVALVAGTGSGCGILVLITCGAFPFLFIYSLPVLPALAWVIGLVVVEIAAAILGRLSR